MSNPVVLMVAEKPSIALSISQILSNGRYSSRKGKCPSSPIHEFTGSFYLPRNNAAPAQLSARFKVTSVIGHIFSCDFPPEYQNRQTVDPESLFAAPTKKMEANPKMRVPSHLKSEAKNADFLVLWLDCDREGENICFEVIDCIRGHVTKENIYRAKFSAITAIDLHNSMKALVRPNQNEALAVDARQELDLKVGVAFSRYQTQYFHQKYGNLDSGMISYGPCQTPTLGFVVDRRMEIVEFSPQNFWTLSAQLEGKTNTIRAKWARERVFNEQVCEIFESQAKKAKHATLTSCTTKSKAKARPVPLNTVELLKVASKNFGMSPHLTMKIAESLYTSGYISYPRTESSKYPENFDLKGALALHANSGPFQEEVKILLNSFSRPTKGHDAGDHPPITPTATAPSSLDGSSLMIYEYVLKHFLASLSPDCKYSKIAAQFEVGGEVFLYAAKKITSPGFTAFMPWLAPAADRVIPTTEELQGSQFSVKGIEKIDGQTSPPGYLTESELITQMEKNGIGTDASIPVHIKNICERNYVTVDSKNRTLIPTKLGIALVNGYHRIDADLVLPVVRSTIEKYIDFIAKGNLNYQQVVSHSLNVFQKKFMFLREHINLMDDLFEASFTQISATVSSKLKVKCGKCNRQMNYLPLKPTRLHCPTCEETYQLPQNGGIQLFRTMTCPLDGFELVSFTQGPNAKSYVLCPYCYNNPPSLKKGEKMEVKDQNLNRNETISESSESSKLAPIGEEDENSRLSKEKQSDNPNQAAIPFTCYNCPHPTCSHAQPQIAFASCPECEFGRLVLDETSAPPNWKVNCNLCSYLVRFSKSPIHKILISKDECETPECEGALLLKFEWKSQDGPNKEKSYLGCLTCDETIQTWTETPKKFFGRGFGRRGRGRGRRGRGRGRRGGGRGRRDF